MGWRHPRITGEQYDEFVDAFIQAVKRRWPNVRLQFEDFAQKNATPLLNRYRSELCCFNDDIQGSVAVTLGCLLADKLVNLLDFQSHLVQPSDSISDWQLASNTISLQDVVRNARPPVLISVSGQPGLFTEEIIRDMHQHCERPIVMPLSNPTSRVEATPEDILRWTRWRGPGGDRQSVCAGAA